MKKFFFEKRASFLFSYDLFLRRLSYSAAYSILIHFAVTSPGPSAATLVLSVQTVVCCSTATAATPTNRVRTGSQARQGEVREAGRGEISGQQLITTP